MKAKSIVTRSSVKRDSTGTKNLVKVYHIGIASSPKISESDTFRQIRMLIRIDDDVFDGI